MKTALVDLSFRHDYTVEQIEEIPTGNDIKHVLFPEGSANYALMIKVTPRKGSPWVATFARAYDSPQALTGILSCPSSEHVCVVSGGGGYIIRASDPDDRQKIPLVPITDARLIKGKGLLVFANFTSLAAYGVGGLLWQSSRLSWDGLRITEVTSEHITGLGWDSPREQEIEFVVDIATGLHHGGSSPDGDVPEQ